MGILTETFCGGEGYQFPETNHGECLSWETQIVPFEGSLFPLTKDGVSVVKAYTVWKYADGHTDCQQASEADGYVPVNVSLGEESRNGVVRTTTSFTFIDYKMKDVSFDEAVKAVLSRSYGEQKVDLVVKGSKLFGYFHSGRKWSKDYGTKEAAVEEAEYLIRQKTPHVVREYDGWYLLRTWTEPSPYTLKVF